MDHEFFRDRGHGPEIVLGAAPSICRNAGEAIDVIPPRESRLAQSSRVDRHQPASAGRRRQRSYEH